MAAATTTTARPPRPPSAAPPARPPFRRAAAGRPTASPGPRPRAGGGTYRPERRSTTPPRTAARNSTSSLARGDLLETWQTSERNAHRGRDYRKIRLEETTFRDHPAVVWEYTFTLKGVAWHARLLGFNVDGKSYQINTWYQPHTGTTALGTYEKVKESFTVF
ncbi:hypothetical protein SHIRM173S_01051 [Streptomyces hirsutus]